MTTLQKAKQIDMYYGNQEILANGAINWTAVEYYFNGDSIGVIHDLYDPGNAENGRSIINDLQQYALSRTGNPIPIMFVEECLHGVAQAGKTVFPAPIGSAAAFDKDLMYQIGATIGKEARANGIVQCFAPVIGTAREPRWGRVVETFGEDVTLTSYMALNYVLGAQGGDPTGGALAANTSIIAEPKHYIAHSAPQSGINTSPVHAGRRELLESFAPQFEWAVRYGGARGIMAAYHELDGVPSCANEYTLTELLRQDWGFTGWVLSDLGAVAMMWNTHGTAAYPADAIAQFLIAGGNSQYYDFPHEVWEESIVNGVANGSLPLSVLDARVADMLRVKMELGLFDNPYTDTSLIARNVNTPEARALALRAARESVVLLQNNPVARAGISAASGQVLRETTPATGSQLRGGAASDAANKYASHASLKSGGVPQQLPSVSAEQLGEGLTVSPVLPMRFSANTRIAVIGPSADVIRDGDYSGPGVSDNFVTVLEGLQAAAAAAGATVAYEQGCQIQSAAAVGVETYPIRHAYLTVPPTSDGAAPQPGLLGQYWPATSIGNGPASFTRLDWDLNFNWYVYGPIAYRAGQPVNGTPFYNATFSALWNGTVTPPVTLANATLAVAASGDPFRLHVNGAVVLDTYPNGTGPTAHNLPFTAGVPLDVAVEYTRLSDNSAVSLEWSLIDDEDSGIAKAASAAASADVAVLVIGEDDSTVGEWVDSDTLALPGRQMDLVNAVVATGTPVIAVLLHGRTLAIPDLAAAVPAVVSAWFGGQQQGQGIADVLTGAYNPAGRTPMSWPVTVGDLPVFYNVKPSASKTGCYYTGCDGGRLWPFGHGLSYTSFNYSNLVVTPASGIVGPTDSLVINVTVTNTGSLDGEDVPQLYVRDVVASTTQPIKQLKGFERVFVPAGASVEVSYTLLPERDLYIIDRSYARVVEPGDFIFWVAPSSALALPATVNGTFAVATADDGPFAVRMGPLSDLGSEVAALSTVAAAEQ